MTSLRTFLTHLAGQHQVVLYDSRGFGLSQREVGTHSLEHDVLDLEAVTNATGLQPLALFASTLAGPCAITFAVHHPARITHLLLFGTYARATDLMSWEQMNAQAELCRTNFDLASQMLADMSHGEEFPDDGSVLCREWKANATGPDVSDQLRIAYSNDVTTLLPEITAQTVVLHRRDDSVIPFSIGQRLAAQIPHARFVPLEGKVHGYMLGDTASLLNAIHAFLGDADQAAPGRTLAEQGAVTTILFTDIVGHTEMMQRLGDAKGRDVLREHERITREALSAHGGTEIKTMGDGFMASFGSVTSAVECAVALQRAFTPDASPTGGEGSPIRIRVGLNAGEPIEEDGDLFGVTVILASRICAQAGPGEILIPEPVRHLLAGKGHIFADRGEFSPKGFDDAVRVYEVRWRE